MTSFATQDFRSNPLRVFTYWAAAILEENNSGDTITVAELRELVETETDNHQDFQAMMLMVEQLEIRTGTKEAA